MAIDTFCPTSTEVLVLAIPAVYPPIGAFASVTVRMTEPEASVSIVLSFKPITYKL